MDWIHGTRDKVSTRGNDASGFVKFWAFLQWLSDCCLLKRDMYMRLKKCIHKYFGKSGKKSPLGRRRVLMEG
jgi:hypothetical protein